MTSVVNPARPVAATRAHGVLGASLPYRRGVGIMLINRDGLVWTGRRLPKWSQNKTNYIWQMPQGGIDAGEDPIVAAFRELKEETGIQSAELIAEYPRLLSYDLPDELMGIALKGRYRGQQQRWFAMRFLGDDSEIDLGTRGGKKAEFDRWRWRNVTELPADVVSFKRPMYHEIVRAFAPYTRPTAQPYLVNDFS
jgi:putative (di)nucleoside polyphosphate hydrolase